MIKFITLILLFFVSSAVVIAQPATEVFVFDLSKEGKVFKLTNPVNISNNEGYDNQPHFLPDGSGILYASNHQGQTEIVKYNINTGESTKITTSEGSEFSPTPHPSGDFFTTIILEKDGTQLLWKYPINGGTPHVIIPESKVGYHCWSDDQTIVSFVLGNPATLETYNIKTSKGEVLDKNIGRSLHKIPGSKLVSYISKSEEKWMIKSIDLKSGKSKDIVTTLDGVEDMAWGNDGSIFMGKGDKLYQFNKDQDTPWVEIASLEQYGLKNISRISVSPNNDKIAIVVDQ